MSTTDNTFSRRRLLQIAGVSAVGATAVAVAGPGQWASAEAAHTIIPRSRWGFTGWQAGGPPRLDKGAITHFVVHYHGATGGGDSGAQVPRSIDREHKADPNNAGILYNFVITQRGEIFGARAYEFKSGATHGANDFSIGVQIHISGSQKPSKAALASLEWLYRHSHAAMGKKKALRITGHQDHTATACPGGPLNRWVDGRGQELYREMAKKLGSGGGSSVPPYPGASAFKVGKRHPAVKTLDQGLIRKGYTKHHDGDGYQAGTLFTRYTRANVRDFQLAQGWTGSGADGYPGPETWKRLLS
ncbi:peptidoglycan-binding protein [Luteipulveratus flavus]|uniref:Peptidoglycan-binding protein n=1 Tax=Luteipulveratus flavus TaxID=3031728 RepID=A0ABT6C8C0_9MICO|nr:peptidoglycan-binding protein [Luteipulveratus sp. YIM 133296]MDF8265184.1 peptidoglycan-binding protein [Luteipulveratus sp. YIM 133296]